MVSNLTGTELFRNAVYFFQSPDLSRKVYFVATNARSVHILFHPMTLGNRCVSILFSRNTHKIIPLTSEQKHPLEFTKITKTDSKCRIALVASVVLVFFFRELL